nr:hypothetical protein [Mucilaginibacter sp. SP1R1]
MNYLNQQISAATGASIYRAGKDRVFSKNRQSADIS